MEAITVFEFTELYNIISYLYRDLRMKAASWKQVSKHVGTSGVFLPGSCVDYILNIVWDILIFFVASTNKMM